MSSIPASLIVSAVLVPNGGASSDLVGAGLDVTHRAHRPSELETDGANVAHQPLGLSHVHAAAWPGAYGPGPGDQIFERIHVLPARKSYPFILSTLEVAVEVWNAYRSAAQSVGAITIAGPGGVTISTPYVLPLAFAPFASKVFTVVVAQSGAARADNTILFDFTGLAEPLFRLTGLRLLPFTISPDWAQGIDDTVEYATAVTVASDDTEQRAMLRAIPNRSIAYRAAALDERENGLLMGLVHAWQGRAFGVLLWMDKAQLGADVLAGAQDITVDTARMGLTAGDTVILISDAFTWFASPVSGITVAGFHFDTPTDQGFFATRTLAVPVKLGRVAPSLGIARPTNNSGVLDVKFDLQVVTDAG